MLKTAVSMRLNVLLEHHFKGSLKMLGRVPYMRYSVPQLDPSAPYLKFKEPPGYVASYRWMMQRPSNPDLERLFFPQRTAFTDDAQNAFLDSSTEAVLSGAPATDEFNYDVPTYFSDIANLDRRLSENLALMGMQKLTPVQRHVIGILSLDDVTTVETDDPNGPIHRVVGTYDLMAASQTGSGKTLAYLVPLMNRIARFYPYEAMQAVLNHPHCQFPSGLILAPTRELVQQIHSVASKLSYRTFLRHVVLFGGERPDKQKTELARGCHLIIATPGRLLDFLRNNLLNLQHCRSLILDEADRMLDMGFEPQLRQILESKQFSMPPPSGRERQTSLYSATFPSEVIDLAKDFLRGTKCISLSLQDTEQGLGVAVPTWGARARRMSTNEVASHLSRMVPREIVQKVEVLSSYHEIEEHLADLLHRILSETSIGLPDNTDSRVLIFCNTKREVDQIDGQLYRRGFRSASIHGDKAQAHRTKALELFRKGSVNVLVASSVAARGLDIPNVRAVINLGVPPELDHYVHRIGRTGRMGHSGEAVTIVLRANLETERSSSSVAHGICRLIKASSNNLDDVPAEFIRFARWRGDESDRLPEAPTHRSYQSARSTNRPFNKNRRPSSSQLDSRYG